jgi:phosphoglycerate dehydrogenase-like enzyme
MPTLEFTTPAQEAISLQARSQSTAAFLLPEDTFELLYGRECAEEVSRRARLHPSGGAGSSQWLKPPYPGWLEEIDALFIGWHGPRLDAELLRHLPRLKAVFHGGGSVRPHVSEAFWARGITISAAAHVNAQPVAEFTLAAIILGLKRAWQLNERIRRERTFPVHPPVPGLNRTVVGLVSLGYIGRLVRERLRAFDVKVIAYDPYLPPARFRELEVESVSLRDLMLRSDAVSLHTPLNRETKGLITGELLELLKPDATFINTSRGGVVHEPELLSFLARRTDVQAVIDVTDPMPPAKDSPFYTLPNVFLTPHIAGSLGPECRRMGWTMVEEYGRYLRGEPLLHTVTREQAELQT